MSRSSTLRINSSGEDAVRPGLTGVTLDPVVRRSASGPTFGARLARGFRGPPVLLGLVCLAFVCGNTAQRSHASSTEIQEHKLPPKAARRSRQPLPAARGVFVNGAFHSEVSGE